ncbi:hypothetical protein F5Y15DRAFT_66088 [Xylariaceae sp. FL0016]|nr:hypothetical protein F5Y15DRAFT_66088 [Xylariaceae sp. FL0016]
MGPGTNRNSQPSSEAGVLSIEGQLIVDAAAKAPPLYQLSWDVTAIPQKGSSAVFQKWKLGDLFYLAHPADAPYRSDRPPYYITSISDESLGNISLDVSKSRWQKPDIGVFLHANRTASDNPLFHESPTLLFKAAAKWMDSRYTWTDSNGRPLAHEEERNGRRCLVFMCDMDGNLRDALVATWCLRLWHDTAESRTAKRDALERMTPPNGSQGYGNTKMPMRVGALGGLGGAGA